MFNHGLTKLLPTTILIVSDYKEHKNMFLYEITHRYLKNDYQFFDTLKIKYRKIRGNCSFLIKFKFHKLE